jgi:hypothetical protein
MRANEFIKLLKEEYDIGQDEFQEAYFDEIVTVVTNVWKRKYPDVELHNPEDEFGAGHTFETKTPSPEKGGFTLSFGSQLYHTEDVHESPENLFYIVVSNAYSGNFKGVVLDMLASVYKLMESKLQEYAPGSNRAEFKRMLGVHHNRNLEAWSNIARKLGAVEEPRGRDQ